MHEIMDVKSYEKYLMKLQISLRKFFIKMSMEFVLGTNICRLSLQIYKNILIYNIGSILILRWIKINR